MHTLEELGLFNIVGSFGISSDGVTLVLVAFLKDGKAIKHQRKYAAVEELSIKPGVTHTGFVAVHVTSASEPPFVAFTFPFGPANYKKIADEALLNDLAVRGTEMILKELGIEAGWAAH